MRLGAPSRSIWLCVTAVALPTSGVITYRAIQDYQQQKIDYAEKREQALSTSLDGVCALTRNVEAYAAAVGAYEADRKRYERKISKV